MGALGNMVLFYTISILSKIRRITPGIPPIALTDIVYGFSGIPPEPIAVIIRSQQKRAARPDTTLSIIFENFSLRIINVTSIIPDTPRRIKRRFIISPFNIMKIFQEK